MLGVKLQLPPAPFADGDTSELLDDKVNGLTTQQAHSKGDIVVTGNELVTNGTFDSDLSGYTTNGNWSWVDGKAYMSSTSSFYYLTQLIDEPDGTELILSFDAYEVSGVMKAIAITSDGLTGVAISTFTTNGTHTFTFTQDGLYKYIGFARDVGSTATCKIDNISVKLKDKVYRCIDDSSANTLLSDTSKFEPIDFVSRLDVIYLTSSGYKSIKGYKNFTDKELVEGGSDIIASKYGFTKLGENLYEILGEKATCLQLTGSRLNG